MREWRQRVMLAGGGEKEKGDLRGWEVFSLSVPVVYISLSFSLNPLPFLCFSLCNWEKWLWVFVCAPACEICTAPFRRSAVAEDKQENPRSSRHASLWRCLSAPFCVRVCNPLCVCVCVWLRGRESVCKSLHRARLCTNHGAHFSFKHTCRHLSERVCVCVCVRFQCLLARQCVCMSIWSCIKET